MATYTSQYPPEQSSTYVKATTYDFPNYYPWFATDPTKSLVGSMADNSWLTSYGEESNQRFHIDLGSAKIIRRIYYENSHHLGFYTEYGAKNFTFWGSNTAGSFADLIYGNDGGWTELTCSQNTFDQHVAADQADPKYITVTNSTAYRYYAFKFADNYGDEDRMSVRRIELQTEDGYVPPPDPPTNVQATDGTHTDKVVITWTKSATATGYQVYRNGVALGWLGDVATYDDTGAGAPTITHGSITASDGTSTANVALSNTGASVNNGTTHTYKVKARNTGGESGYSGTNTGYRGHGTLTYQWYRSNVDGDSGYGSISGATSSTHNDTAAPAGSKPGVPTGLTASDGTYTDKVALAWTNVSGGSGAGRYYKCYHTATGATPGYTGVNRGYRKAYTSTNTQAKRDTTELGAIGSLATSYNDTGAAAPTITPGTASASDGTSAYHVTCSVSGESANNGTTHSYYVRTYNAAGWGNYCSANTGYRGHGPLTYQWQRSAADSDANYSNIPGATTDPYNDTGAPADGSGRYYRCVINATGASQQISASDRGYRFPPFEYVGTGTLTYSGSGICHYEKSDWEYAGSGIFNYSGEAIQSHTKYFLYDTSGNFVYSGEATISYIFNYLYVGDGQFIFSGTATQIHSRYYLYEGIGLFTYSGKAFHRWGDWAEIGKEGSDFQEVTKETSDFVVVGKKGSDWTKIDKEKGDWEEIDKG